MDRIKNSLQDDELVYHLVLSLIGNPGHEIMDLKSVADALFDNMELSEEEAVAKRREIAEAYATRIGTTSIWGGDFEAILIQKALSIGIESYTLDKYHVAAPFRAPSFSSSEPIQLSPQTRITDPDAIKNALRAYLARTQIAGGNAKEDFKIHKQYLKRVSEKVSPEKLAQYRSKFPDEPAHILHVYSNEMNHFQSLIDCANSNLIRRSPKAMTRCNTMAGKTHGYHGVVEVADRPPCEEYLYITSPTFGEQAGAGSLYSDGGAAMYGPHFPIV